MRSVALAVIVLFMSFNTVDASVPVRDIVLEYRAATNTYFYQFIDLEIDRLTLTFSFSDGTQEVKNYPQGFNGVEINDLFMVPPTKSISGISAITLQPEGYSEINVILSVISDPSLHTIYLPIVSRSNSGSGE